MAETRTNKETLAKKLADLKWKIWHSGVNCPDLIENTEHQQEIRELLTDMDDVIDHYSKLSNWFVGVCVMSEEGDGSWSCDNCLDTFAATTGGEGNDVLDWRYCPNCGAKITEYNYQDDEDENEEEE